MKKRRVYTTWAQRRLLSYTKTLLAEQGYFFYPVATWYRRHKLDRIAILRDSLHKPLLLRAGNKGVIEIKPYVDPSLYLLARKKLRERIPTGSRVRFMRQLPQKKGYYGWKEYIDPKYHEDLKFLLES